MQKATYNIIIKYKFNILGGHHQNVWKTYLDYFIVILPTYLVTAVFINLLLPR